MRVLCLSQEKNLLANVGEVFSDRIAMLQCMVDPEAFLVAAKDGAWEIFLVDCDALHSSFSNPVDFVKKLAPANPPLVIGSSSFANWHHDLTQLGALVLHKPTTIGEIGLALRKLMADARAKGKA